METRKTRKDAETQETQATTASEIETNEGKFTSLLKKLGFFNRSTKEATKSENIDEINRQYSLIKSKLDEAHSLIQTIQCLKIESDENDDAIDEWTKGKKAQLLVYEKAVETLDEWLKHHEARRKERSRDQKLEEEAIIRSRIREEEEEAERQRRVREEEFVLQLEAKKLERKSVQRKSVRNPNFPIYKSPSSKGHTWTG